MHKNARGDQFLVSNSTFNGNSTKLDLCSYLDALYRLIRIDTLVVASFPVDPVGSVAHSDLLRQGPKGAQRDKMPQGVQSRLEERIALIM